jgi:hypothetical protein
MVEARAAFHSSIVHAHGASIKSVLTKQVIGKMVDSSVGRAAVVVELYLPPEQEM